MNSFNVDGVYTFLSTQGIDIAIKVLAAIAFWVIGRWLIGKVATLIQKLLSVNKIDATLSKYLGTIVGVLLNIVLVIGILGYFGMETTSFAALLAGAGIAIGSAWGGLLSSFAAGAFLLILRPFRAGDFVSVGGITGTVRELGMFGTSIITPDNVLTIIGNNKIFSGDIINYHAIPVRRVDRTAQISGAVDPLEAIEKFRAAVVQIKNVAQTPAPEVFILDFNPAGAVIAVRPYTNNDNYWQVYADTNAAIAQVSKAAGWPVAGPLQFIRQV